MPGAPWRRVGGWVERRQAKCCIYSAGPPSRHFRNQPSMRITVTVDVAPEEVPMATELLAVLR